MDGNSFEDIADALEEYFFGEEEETCWGDDFDDLPEEECEYDPMDPNGIGEE